ncbi:MAG: MFS transporter [bacterium]|nr:MFS transporter [bacterium]
MSATTAKSPSLIILGLVMFINSLSYATIIPLLYPFASQYGIDPFGLSLLFASFSIAQFLATPIIGRLSDKYGRKPLLLLCLLGTSLSLALFASATNMLMLFVARIADGITGGNNSVAQAMIADSTTGPERAKGFGVLGASMGFGFLIGPALGGLMSGFGLTAPFWFAAGLALVGTVVGALVLPETLNKKNQQEAKSEPLFNFSSIFHALLSKSSGLVLLISFIAALALNGFIFGFQTYTHDILLMNPTEVGLLLAMFGLVGIVMQLFGLRVILKYFTSKKKIITISLVLSAICMAAAGFTSTPFMFTAVLFIFSILSAPQNPLITGILSERTNPEDQGEMLGINQSYMSLGQIFAPLAAGAVAASISISASFFLTAALFALGAIASLRLYTPVKKADL